MSFKSFKDLNDYIASTADVVDKLESIVSLCQSGVSQLSAIKQISDAYARQYSLVQQIQYDADGNIQDVTSEERQSIPNTVIDNAKSQTERLSLAIKRINPVELGSTALNMHVTPIAKVYSNEQSSGTPTLTRTIENYYYQAGDNTLYLSADLLDVLKDGKGYQYGRPGMSAYATAPLTLKIPYTINGVPGVHQLKWMGQSELLSEYPAVSLLVHTGEFDKIIKVADAYGKDLFTESTYDKVMGSNGLNMITVSSDWQKTNCPVDWIRSPGQPITLHHNDSSGRSIVTSVDFYYSIESQQSTDIWAILVGLADNSKSIMQILNTL